MTRTMCSAECLPGRHCFHAGLMGYWPEPPVQAPAAMQGIGAVGEGGSPMTC